MGYLLIGAALAIGVVGLVMALVTIATTASGGSSPSRSRAVTNPSAVSFRQTGNPLWPSLSTIRRVTSATVSSGDTVETSWVMYSSTRGLVSIRQV